MMDYKRFKYIKLLKTRPKFTSNNMQLMHTFIY